MAKIIASLVISLACINAFAGNAWYWGKVTKIQTLHSDGSFLAYVDNDAIKANCKYDRVEFLVSDMGLERTKLAYSMALTSISTGNKWGVVLDMPASEDICRVPASASQGAGISASAAEGN